MAGAPRQPHAAADRWQLACQDLHSLTTLASPRPPAPHYRYPPDALAGLPDPTANIFVEKGVEDGAELLRRLQRLRGLLDQQRKAAARAAAAGSAAGSSATGAAGGDSAAASGCSRPVRLLIVDSVAHVFRDMGDSVGVGELAGRTQALFKLSALLR